MSFERARLRFKGGTIEDVKELYPTWHVEPAGKKLCSRCHQWKPQAKFMRVKRGYHAGPTLTANSYRIYKSCNHCRQVLRGR